MDNRHSTDSIAENAVSLKRINLSIGVNNKEVVQILNEVSLNIPERTLCGLVGPSGSGKTSLLTIIAGLRRPSGGTAKVLGYDFADYDEEQLAGFRRDNIGVVFQNFHLLPSMTALENVAMPLELAETIDSEMQAATLLEAVGLAHRLNHFPHQLSGGEQQRTAIARAFVARPRLILADEPTGNLDAATSGTIMETLHEMRIASGSCMLLITHNEKLLEHADMVAKMDNGQLNHG